MNIKSVKKMEHRVSLENPDKKELIGYFLTTENDEVLSVPLDKGNKEYIKIMREVEAGRITIADAD
tara:strand:- start:824 stop:1021 length:198 start_codon:yes stop_codon:yes gene_type:complete